jgi:hypothetical protein
MVQAPPPARRHLPGADQCHHRGERHLERGAGQRLGRGDEHDDRRPRHQAQRQRRAVEQHGDQGKARHGAGALRRHRRTGQRGIEERHQQGEHGRDLLGIDAQRQRRHQRDGVAQHAHHQGDHEDDVQAGDRQDVGEARVAHGLGDVLVDGGLLAGQQGGHHAAFRARQGGEDARRDVGAQRIDGANDAVRAAAFDHRRRRQRIAHGAQLLVPGDALEIERPALPLEAAVDWPAPWGGRRRERRRPLTKIPQRTRCGSWRGAPLPFSLTASGAHPPSGSRWMTRPSTLMLNNGRLSVGAARLAVRGRG